jgi:hypothetical protein
VAKKGPWKNRIVAEADVLASELVANPGNARRHPPEQAAAMDAVLDQVGFVQRVVVNKRSGLLLDGHLRVERAAERGWTVPVAFVSLTRAEEATVLATFDAIGLMASYDEVALTDLLNELDRSIDPALDALLGALARRDEDDRVALDGLAGGEDDDEFMDGVLSGNTERIIALLREREGSDNAMKILRALRELADVGGEP